MKKITARSALFFLLMQSISFSLYAQSQNNLISYGFKAGVGLYKLSGLNSFNPDFTSVSDLSTEYKTGFTGGAFVSFPLWKHFYFQPEVNFQMQGAKISYTGNIGDISGIRMNDKYNLNYINIPLLLKYQIPTTSLSFYLGPQAGFMIGAKNIHQAEDMEATSQSIKDDLMKNDFAGVYGLEYFLPIENNSHTIVLNARYTTGFTKVFKNSYPYLQHPNKNRGFAFSMGYRF